jgi:hypothetical protein
MLQALLVRALVEVVGCRHTQHATLIRMVRPAPRMHGLGCLDITGLQYAITCEKWFALGFFVVTDCVPICARWQQHRCIN